MPKAITVLGRKARKKGSRISRGNPLNFKVRQTKGHLKLYWEFIFKRNLRGILIVTLQKVRMQNLIKEYKKAFWYG